MRPLGGRAAGLVALLSSLGQSLYVNAGLVHGRQASLTGSSASTVSTTTTGSSSTTVSSSTTGSSSTVASASATDSKSSTASITDAPSPWVSIKPDGPTTTITPLVTTINGMATTIDAPPAVPVSTATGSASPTPSSGSFPVCHDSSGPFGPFCQPTNGSDVWVGETYFVTWDSNYFGSNSTISIWLNYVDPMGGGKEAWHSDPRANSYGFVSVQMDNSWLKDNPRNNLTFYLVEVRSGEAKSTVIQGPTVSLINKPAQHYPPPPRTQAPNKLGLEVGIPVSLGFILLILCGLCIGMRKHRTIGLGNISLGRSNGYGVGKSRRQRIKRSKKAGPIQLGDSITPAPRDAGFRDDPIDDVELAERRPRPRGHDRDNSLGSLVDSPTEGTFRQDQRRGNNAFRDELARQKTGGRP